MNSRSDLPSSYSSVMLLVMYKCFIVISLVNHLKGRLCTYSEIDSEFDVSSLLKFESHIEIENAPRPTSVVNRMTPLAHSEPWRLPVLSSVFVL